MKLHQVLGIGILGLASLVGCNNEPILTSNNWAYKKTEEGFTCVKQTANGKLNYSFIRKDRYVYLDTYPKEEDIYISLDIKNMENTLTIIDYDNGWGDVKTDGNINRLVVNTPFLKGELNFADDGYEYSCFRKGDFIYYNKEDTRKLYLWANQKFKDVQAELKEEFGNLVRYPNERPPDEMPVNIEKILELFK